MHKILCKKLKIPFLEVFKGYGQVFVLNATGFDTFSRAQVENSAINTFDLWKARNYIYKYI